MSHSRIRLSACALAAAAFLVACGGGGTTPDTTAPTVTITDNISGTATSSVTFSFTFNEAVTGFTADDVSVNNGTKGAFTMATDGLSATLVVTPPSTGSGFIEVSVAAGAFADVSNNANTAAVNASQAFGAPTPAAYISFDENPATVTDIGAYGGALPEVAASPSGGNANALKIAKPAGQGNETWGGTYFTVPRVPFTSTQKAITARVYSTVANAVIRLKVEVAGGTSVEVAGTTVEQANTWTTVTWNFASADLAANYTVLAVTPDVDRALDGAVYYLDDINVVDTPATSVVTFASNFSGANNTTSEGGSFGGYSGSSGDNWNCNGAPENCGSGLNDDSGKDRFYYYYNAPASTSGLYVGTYFMAPGVTTPLSGNVSGLSVAGKSKFNFTFGQNSEWFNSAGERNFGVLLTMSNVYSVGGGTNNCRVELWQVVTPTSANDTAYSINLSNFVVRQDCGVPNLTVASALTDQTVAQIDFKANAGTSRFPAVNGQQEGANTTNATGGVYPTTLIVKGPLQFQ